MKDDSRERFPESVLLSGRKRETARQEFSARKEILDLLRARGPQTVRELAASLSISADEATWWLMGFVRYNKVKASEKADDEGYYRYAILEVK
ncbi:MAG: MarR family transcriptional regulator [Candidatus Aminicenantes bacterium]|nr:MarR family transcriptional regulator [Candidatus Aminicenantes bacterium]